MPKGRGRLPAWLERARGSWRWPVAQFVAAGAVMLVLLVVSASWLSTRAAVAESVDDAETTTVLLVASVIEPELPRGLAELRPAALDKFDRKIRSRVLVGDVLRVKVWDADGRIVYSDATQLIGRQFGLDDDELEVLRSGGSEAESSDLDKPENTYERELGRLLEVYTQVRTREGEPLLFEAYYSYDDVTEGSADVLDAFLPITVGGLLGFLLLTVPLVWVLARRLDSAKNERVRLLQAAVTASEVERGRIARDLHDGLVQEMAGQSFALSATAQELPERPDVAGRLADLAAGTRASIRSLRSLLVEIYPPDLEAQGLEAALNDLVAPASDAGVEVDLQVGQGEGVGREESALVWRVAQEAVRNSLRHAQARHMSIRLDTDARRTLFLLSDDGVGFDPGSQPPEGHLGLRMLEDLARARGANLEVSSRPGAGTTVRLEVPHT